MDLFSQIAEITKPVFMPIPTQPEERTQTAPRIFTNVPDIIKEVRKISYSDQMTWEQFNQLYKDITDQEPAIMQMINKMTIAEMQKFIYKQSGDTKKDMTERLFDRLIGSFNLGGMISYSPFAYMCEPGTPTTYKGALNARLQSQTAEDLIKYQETKATARATRKKALENPETLDEFRIFLDHFNPDKMSSEQRARYDELITDKRQERREVEQKHKAEVTAVKVEGLEMEIKTSHHAKKNIPLWVVVLSERVTAEVFNELKAKAHKFDGYYSSYRGQGAIPGFTFETEEGAKLFCDLQKGNVNAHELNKSIEQETRQERAETLEEKAQRMKDEANEQLNTERKANTHKRAAEAAHAERTALYNIEFAETMAKIAEGQKTNTIKYLTRLQTITELETLNMILSRAKYKFIREKNINSQREDTDQYNTSLEIIDYVIFPYPSVYISNAKSDILKLTNAPGCKLAAARILKRFNLCKSENYYFTTAREIEDFETLLCKSSNFSKYYKEELLQYKRVMRMQLESIFELRTALRELIQIKKSAKITPEMKKAQELRELDRKFIGVDIPGFFPTPRELAAQVVEMADIQPGNTILEPSAGLGHLAEVIQELHPDNYLLCIEQHNSLCEALRLKGFNTIHMDFLEEGGATFDRIVMNPPFENGQDIAHVMKAYSLLNDGGRLIAIMAGNKGNSNQKTREFMEFVEQHGEYKENPAGSFLSAFRPTGVNTITVILNK